MLLIMYRVKWCEWMFMFEVLVLSFRLSVWVSLVLLLDSISRLLGMCWLVV